MFLLRIQVCWDVMFVDYVVAFHYSKETVTHRHIPEDMNLQQNCCGNLTSCMCFSYTYDSLCDQIPLLGRWSLPT